MEQRILLMQVYQTGAFSVTELCRRFDISRETFYFWKRRYDTGEQDWFVDHSSAPHTNAHALDQALCERIVQLRKRFKHFGPKKIRAKRGQEMHELPAASTIGEVLKREGLIEASRRRHRAVGQGSLITQATLPNDEWAMDFKGWAKTADGHRCDPLTISDTVSRYLFEVRIIRPTHDEVKAVLTRTFREYGMPLAIRSDNGSPFGSNGAGGLSRLAIWLIKTGIEPRFIPPGEPENNGRHERMHRTLKAETMKPPASDPTQQQRRFNQFRKNYNEERPHEALDLHTPASQYTPSCRMFTNQFQTPDYSKAHEIRRVRSDGTIKWKGEFAYISESLVGELVALTEREEEHYLVQYFTYDLGVMNDKKKLVRFAPRRAKLRTTKPKSVHQDECQS